MTVDSSPRRASQATTNRGTRAPPNSDMDPETEASTQLFSFTPSQPPHVPGLVTVPPTSVSGIVQNAQSANTVERSFENRGFVSTVNQYHERPRSHVAAFESQRDAVERPVPPPRTAPSRYLQPPAETRSFHLDPPRVYFDGITGLPIQPAYTLRAEDRAMAEDPARTARAQAARAQGVQILRDMAQRHEMTSERRQNWVLRLAEFEQRVAEFDLGLAEAVQEQRAIHERVLRQNLLQIRSDASQQHGLSSVPASPAPRSHDNVEVVDLTREIAPPENSFAATSHIGSGYYHGGAYFTRRARHTNAPAVPPSRDFTPSPQWSPPTNFLPEGISVHDGNYPNPNVFLAHYRTRAIAPSPPAQLLYVRSSCSAPRGPYSGITTAQVEEEGRLNASIAHLALCGAFSDSRTELNYLSDLEDVQTDANPDSDSSIFRSPPRRTVSNTPIWGTTNGRRGRRTNLVPPAWHNSRRSLPPASLPPMSRTQTIVEENTALEGFVIRPESAMTAAENAASDGFVTNEAAHLGSDPTLDYLARLNMANGSLPASSGIGPAILNEQRTELDDHPLQNSIPDTRPLPSLAQVSPHPPQFIPSWAHTGLPRSNVQQSTRLQPHPSLPPRPSPNFHQEQPTSTSTASSLSASGLPTFFPPHVRPADGHTWTATEDIISPAEYTALERQLAYRERFGIAAGVRYALGAIWGRKVGEGLFSGWVGEGVGVGGEEW